MGFFVSTRIVAQYLGPSQYGQLVFIYSHIALLGSLVLFGMDSILVRELCRSRFSRSDLLGTATWLRLGLSLGVYMGYGLLILAWGGEDKLLYLLVALTLFAKPIEYICRDIFEAEVNNHYISWVVLSGFILAAGFNVMAVLNQADLEVFVMIFMGQFTWITLLLWIFIQLQGKFARRDWNWNKKVAMSLVRDSFPLWLAAFGALIYLKIDIFFLSGFRDSYEVGVYGAASRFGELFAFVPSISVMILMPKFVILWERFKENEGYEKQLKLIYGAAAWGGLGLGLFFYIFSSYLIQIIFGSEFELAGRVLQIQALAILPIFMGIVRNRMLIVEGKQYYLFACEMTGAGLNIILNLLWIPTWGVMGAAWATVISYSIGYWGSSYLWKSVQCHGCHQLKGFYYGIKALKSWR